MKLCWLLALFIVAAVANELPLAELCNAEACQLPNCRCSSTEIPGGLSPRDTPQFVMITFDDAVNIINIETYNRLLDNKFSSKNCPIGATFYVSHEYTNYQLVNQLYNKGYEIALHSISHLTNQSYWQNADRETVQREFGDQIELMSHFANIPRDVMKGVRMPFLQMTGNSTFEVIVDNGLEYDCSWPTVTFRNPGLWPYTLDYASSQDCQVPPCPTASIPNSWVLPMISWTDLDGNPCAMVDSCFAVPPLDDADAWYEFIVTNFERHYLGNRAPFGFFIHEWYLSSNPAVETALSRFIETLRHIPDAFIVNSQEVIDWVKNPVPVNEYASNPCKSFTPTSCFPAASCGPLLISPSHQSSYWMAICNNCPVRYPWLGNPLGLLN